MSIWTSRRASRLLACLATAAALIAAGVAGRADDALPSLTVTTGKIRIVGPQGYCADRTASRDGGTQAFVFLATCDTVRGKPPSGAILTASVLVRTLANGEPMAVILPEMERFFRSTAGRQALSRAGRAATVEVISTEQQGDALFLRARDRAPMKGVALQPDYWRAVMTVKGRMVTLSVLGRADSPLGSQAMRSLLDAFVKRVRQSNGSS